MWASKWQHESKSMSPDLQYFPDINLFTFFCIREALSHSPSSSRKKIISVYNMQGVYVGLHYHIVGVIEMVVAELRCDRCRP